MTKTPSLRSAVGALATLALLSGGRAPAVTGFTLSPPKSARASTATVLGGPISPSSLWATRRSVVDDADDEELGARGASPPEAQGGGPPPPPTRTRREALLSGSAVTVAAVASSMVLSPGLVGGPRPALAAGGTTGKEYLVERQNVLITGANSGLGLDAATRLAARGHRVVLACRSLSKARGAADAVRSALRDSGGSSDPELVPVECDLASLASVRACVEGLKKGGETFDAVCYNAGLARNTGATEVKRTEEGFELTVGTNHLGHFYLNHLILPLVRRGTGTVVVTASSVHDPDSPGGAQGSTATLGDLSGLATGPTFDMVDGGAFNADKAYKDSKLCNVLFARELQRRIDADESTAGIAVNAFTPGLIVGTGLFRDQNPVFTKLFDFAATSLLKVGETPSFGGGCLEYMVLDKSVRAKGGRYYFSSPGSSKYGEAAYGNQFAPAEVSKEARDDAKAGRLWELSSKLVKI